MTDAILSGSLPATAMASVPTREELLLSLIHI